MNRRLSLLRGVLYIIACASRPAQRVPDLVQAAQSAGWDIIIGVSILPVSRWLLNKPERKIAMTAVTQAPGAASTYRSPELEQLQALPNSPFGMQFLLVPALPAPVPIAGDATTRSCEETSRDGKSTLDCVDDDD